MQVQLHKEILTEQAKKQFGKLKNFKEDFYLAGGTAMALQIGHRVSIDFDFFSFEPIKKTLLKKVEEVFKGSDFKILENSSRELTLLIDSVKYTFLHYPFLVLDDFVKTDELKLMSVKEILSTKAYSVGRRGAIKDYIDIYFGLKENYSDLSKIIEMSNKKYGDAFNSRLFLEQIIYMDDLDFEDVVMTDHKLPSKEEMTVFFENAIKAM